MNFRCFRFVGWDRITNRIEIVPVRTGGSGPGGRNSTSFTVPYTIKATGELFSNVHLLPQMANATEAGIISKMILSDELWFPAQLSAGNQLFSAGNSLITGANPLRGRLQREDPTWKQRLTPRNIAKHSKETRHCRQAGHHLEHGLPVSG